MGTLYCTLFIAGMTYLINEFSIAIIYYLVLCFFSCLFWSVLFRWLTQKNHVDPNSDKLKFVIGLSSGNINTTIISQKK